MPRLGPPPKPTALRLLEGNPSHRPMPTNEPKVKPSMPAAPKWLGPLARAEWRRIAPELHALGLLTRIDRAALVAYCCAWETFVQVEQQLAGGVPLVQMTTGGEAPCALLRVRALATKQLRDFLLEFGLTPAARTRIQVNPDSVADDDESTAQRLIGG